MNASNSRRCHAIACALALGLSASLAAAASSFPAGDYAAGKESIHFDANGSLRVTSGSKVLVDGSYAVDADRIRFTDKSGPMACTAKDQESGSYRWKQTGDALVFTKVDDRCEGRSQDLTGKSWTKK